MTYRYLHIPYLQNCRRKPEAVTHVGFLWWLSSKKKKILLPVPASEGIAGSAPGLGRSSGEGNGNPLQNSCLGNPMDRGAWQATVQGVAKSQTGLSKQHHVLGYMEAVTAITEVERLGQDLRHDRGFGHYFTGTREHGRV